MGEGKRGRGDEVRWSFRTTIIFIFFNISF
jgi:hypothetical protein